MVTVENTDGLLVAGRLLLPALRYLASVHSRSMQILAEAGIRAQSVHDHEARIPQSNAITFLRLASAATNDPLFAARAAWGLDRTTLTLMEYMVSAQASGRDAFERASRFSILAHDAMSLRLFAHEDATCCAVEILGQPVDCRPLAEYIIGMMACFSRNVVAPTTPIICLEFVHAPCASREAYQSVFGLPVRFRRERTAVVFGGVLSDEPLHSSDPVLAQLLERQAEEKLSRLPAGPSIRQRAAAWLRFEMGQGPIGIEDAAQAFRMSQRTLRRRLRDEGTSYSALLESIRRDRALDLIEDSSVNLDGIAVALGFAGTSALRRAFQRWTGTSPSNYRSRVAAVGSRGAESSRIATVPGSIGAQSG